MTNGNKYLINSGKEDGESAPVDYEQFDIIPDELKMDVRNSWRDRDAGVQYNLSKLSERELWVCYTTPKGGDEGEDSSSITAIGELSIPVDDAVDLDTDTLAAFLDERTADIPTEIIGDVAVEYFSTNTDEVAELLNEKHKARVVERLWIALEKGTASTNGELVWVRDDTDEYASIAEDVLRELPIDDTDDGVLTRLFEDALSNYPKEEIDSSLPQSAPPTMSVSSLSFVEKEWIARSVELRQRAGFYPQTAKSVALYEQRSMKIDVAEELGISSSTVGEHIKRSRKQYERARWIVDNLEHLGE